MHIRPLLWPPILDNNDFDFTVSYITQETVGLDINIANHEIYAKNTFVLSR